MSIYKIKQADMPRREADRYIISTLLTLDDAKFRKLLSDAGVALGTATVRASAILTIMDEFFTTPSDLNNPLPLKEVTVYKYDRDTNYKEQEGLSAKSLDSRSLSTKNRESGSVSAREQGAGSYSGRGSVNASSPEGSGAASGAVKAQFAQKASVDGQYSKDGSRDTSSLKKGQLNYNESVNASDSEHAFFQNIKEWQPKNSIPAKENYTVGAMGDVFRTYDIRSLSNDLFRSKYFGHQVITIEKLENSQDLAKYVKFAKTDAKADFFAVGTSVMSRSRCEFGYGPQHVRWYGGGQGLLHDRW